MNIYSVMTFQFRQIACVGHQIFFVLMINLCLMSACFSVQAEELSIDNRTIIFKPNLNLKIDGDDRQYKLTPYVYYYRDTSAELTLEEVKSQHAKDFRLYEDQGQLKNFGFTSDAIWLVFNIRNVSKENLSVTLQLSNSLLSAIEVYVPSKHGYLKSKAGKSVHVMDRDIPINTPTFRAQFASNSITQVYVRVTSLYSITIPITAYTGDAFSDHLFMGKMIEGIVFGTIIALLVYNLFMLYVERSVNYFFIALYIIAFTCNTLSIHGYTIYWWPSSLYWNHIFNFVSALVVIFSVAIQAMYYMDLKRNAPKWNRFFRYLIAYTLIICMPVAFKGSSMLISFLIIPVALSLIVSVMTVSIQQAMAGLRTAKIYLISIMVPAVIATIWLFYQISVIEPAPYMELYLSIAIVIQQILLSLGVAERMHLLKVEKEESESLAYTAQSQSRAKSRLLAQMSHEIRTPISGVIGMSEVLCDAPLNSYQMNYATMVRGAAKQLLSIVNNILDYSKLEAGKMEMEEIEFSLDEVLQETIIPLSSRVEDKGVELFYGLLMDVPNRLLGDAGKIGNVIQNLIDNAISHTSSGHIIVTAKVRINEVEPGRFKRKSKKQANSARIDISVSDTSSGLTEGKKRHLFSSDFKTGVDNFSGSTIGMKIVMRYVELLNADISVDSAPGEGCAFNLSIPITLGQRIEEPFNGVLRARRVLLIENNIDIARLYEKLFVSSGAQFNLSSNNMDELNAIQRSGELGERYDLCVIGSSTVEMKPFYEACIESKIPCITLVGHSELIRYKDNPAFYGSAYVAEKLNSFAHLSESIQHILAGEMGRQHLIGAAESVDRTGLKVLVAEDNPVNQIVIDKVLRSYGVRAVIANNGREAVDLYEQSQGDFDIIFMDCEMPELNGFDATNRIRCLEKDTKLNKVLVVALTAHMDDEITDKILERGMDDYLAKPVDRSKIHHKLEKFGF